jgi:hypothetical protein
VLISGIINANQSVQGFLWYFSLPAIFCTVTNVLMVSVLPTNAAIDPVR